MKQFIFSPARNESMPCSIFSPYVIWQDFFFFATLEGIKGYFIVCLIWTFLMRCLIIFSFMVSLVVWVYSFVKNLFKFWDNFVVCHMITEYDNSLYFVYKSFVNLRVTNNLSELLSSVFALFMVTFYEY